MAFDFWGPVFTQPNGFLFSPGFTGNTYQTNVWDFVTFAGQPTPGLAEVNVEKERAVDEKKSAGSDGATLTIHGSKPARIEIKLTIWTPDQLRALNELWPILMTPPYKTVHTTATVFTNPAPSAVTNTTTGSTNTIPAAVTGNSRQNPRAITVVNATAGNVSTISTPVVATKTVRIAQQVPVTFVVTHPMFRLHGINRVQIIGGRGPDLGSIVRSRVFTIKAVEYSPTNTKKNATKTDEAPIGSAFEPGADTSPPPGSNPSNTGP
jgi:hypothetical protein